jgi:hypothetical protein
MRREMVRLCSVALLLAAGCGDSGNRPMTKDDVVDLTLSDVGEVYRMYTVDKKKPPAKTADITPLERVNPTGVHAIESGDVVVRFGAALPDTGEMPGQGPDDEVLAYMKDVPESGGKVLMLNRTVRTMTPEEFKSAKLAGTESSKPTPARGKGKAKGR